MDWLIDRRDPASAEQVLRGLEDHLRRHAADATGVPEAVRSVEALVSDIADAVQRLTLDWRTERPTVRLGAIDSGHAAASGIETGRSLLSEQRVALDGVATEPRGELRLDIRRRVPDTFDDGPPPMAQVATDPREHGAASVAVALAAAAEAHPSSNPAQLASLAGSALADAVAGENPPTDAPAVAALIVEAHQALGSDARVLATDEETLEVAVSRCPFGFGAPAASSLCHVSTGLAGRLAARVTGRSTVVLEETIAAGDQECRLQLWLGTPEEEVRGESHRWPPTAGATAGPTPNFDLSLNLPREGGSVPVVRRLAAQALRAFGVMDGDVDDVQLSISEACANVIDHAGDTDTYEVQVELAADRCAITVVDQGGGFDATAVPEDAEVSAETGRGLALMRALVDNLSFRSEPQAGAVVHMVKTLTYDPTHPLWRSQGGRVPGDA